MYKKQLKIQKIVCLLALVVAVILFLYSLGIMTDIYDTLYSALRIKVEEDASTAEGYSITASERSVKGAILYFNMQDFNKTFVKLAIIHILIACLLFVTNTSSRRKYYISNYISMGLYVAGSIYIPIYAHRYIEAFKAQWKQVDFAALKEFSTTYNSAYTESTMWLDLHYFVFALMLLAAVIMIANCVWKICLMKEERKLVENGKKVRT